MSQQDIPRLKDVCKRVLKSNVHLIRDFGTIPYDLIADVLPIMLPDQLLQVEAASPDLAQHTNRIWRGFVFTRFPQVKRQHTEDQHNGTAPKKQDWRQRFYDEQDAEAKRMAEARLKLKGHYQAISNDRAERAAVHLAKPLQDKRTSSAQRDRKSLLGKARMAVSQAPVRFHKPVSRLQQRPQLPPRTPSTSSSATGGGGSPPQDPLLPPAASGSIIKTSTRKVTQTPQATSNAKSAQAAPPPLTQTVPSCHTPRLAQGQHGPPIVVTTRVVTRPAVAPHQSPPAEPVPPLTGKRARECESVGQRQPVKKPKSGSEAAASASASSPPPPSGSANAGANAGSSLFIPKRRTAAR